MQHDTNEFYDTVAAHYHLFYRDWWAAVERDGAYLHRLFDDHDIHTVLDASCGPGTQAIGLAQRGYRVTGVDPSGALLALAVSNAQEAGVAGGTTFLAGSFLELPDVVTGPFDAVITKGNALPHLIEDADIEQALRYMYDLLRPGGMLVIGMRDFDELLEERPRFIPRQIRDDEEEQHILFDIWDWDDGPPPTVTFNAFIVSGNGDQWRASRHPVVYRALRKSELWALLEEVGFVEVVTTEHLWEVVFMAHRPG